MPKLEVDTDCVLGPLLRAVAITACRDLRQTTAEGFFRRKELSRDDMVLFGGQASDAVRTTYFVRFDQHAILEA